MFNWIARNLSTIIICLVLAAVVALIIVSLVKDKRKAAQKTALMTVKNKTVYCFTEQTLYYI